MAQNQFKNDSYVEVAERIAEFRAKHPEGSLQQLNLQFLEFGGKAWVVYTAAAYRTPDDPRPGHGTAWEEVPGRTNFTRDSEVQNAETSAWGRALVAVLAADTQKGIASANEVRARQGTDSPKPSAPAGVDPTTGEIKATTTRRPPPVAAKPQPAPPSEASREAVLKSIATLSEPQQDSLRELAREAQIPNIKGPHFTEEHYKRLLVLIDLVLDAAA